MRRTVGQRVEGTQLGSGQYMLCGLMKRRHAAATNSSGVEEASQLAVSCPVLGGGTAFQQRALHQDRWYM